jgi:hypothetical protein
MCTAAPTLVLSADGRRPHPLLILFEFLFCFAFVFLFFLLFTPFRHVYLFPMTLLPAS